MRYNIITSYDNHILPLMKKVEAKVRMNRLLTETKGKVPVNFYSPVVWMDWLNTPGKMVVNFDFSKLINIGYTWMVSKIRYDIDPLLQRLIIESELPKNFPTDLLSRIPLWTGYLDLTDTPIAFYGDEITGIFISRSVNQENQPVITVSYPNVGTDESSPWPGFIDIPISENIKVEDVLQEDLTLKRLLANKEGNRAAALEELKSEKGGYYEMAKAFINLVFYIVSQSNEDYWEEDCAHFVGRHAKVNRRKEYTLPFRNAIRKITLGKDDTEAVNSTQFKEGVLSEYGEPHIRCGHYHGYWTGSKSDPSTRRLEVKWLKPILVTGRKIN